MAKKLLFITTKYPYPLVSGDRLRAYHLIRILALQYEVDVFVLENSSDRDPRFGSGATIREDCTDTLLPVGRVFYIRQPKWKKYIERFRTVLRGIPIQTAYYSQSSVRRYVKERSNDYDILFCHLARTAECARDVSIPKILDYSDAYSLLYAPYHRPKGFWGWFSRIEYPRMLAYERAIADRFDHCLATSSRDAHWLAEQCGVPQEKLCIVPNGVSDELFTHEREESQFPTLVFSGNMRYYPNVDAIAYFVREIFPKVQKIVPSIKLVIVGAHPHKRVQALQNNAITVTGYVDDVSEYVKRATIAIAPLRTASGVQNKVLEAMALGVPVVTTPVVAEGIEGTPEDCLVVSKTDKEMVDDILALLGDNGKRARIGGNARDFIRASYRWSDSEKKLLDLLIGFPPSRE